MTEALDIRKCTKADIAAVGRFYDRIVLWLDDHINYPRWIYGTYPSKNSVRIATEAESQYMCTLDGLILGAFILDTQPLGDYRKGRWSLDLADCSYMVLHALAIDPEMQGQGLGSQVVRYCADKAKSEGYKALRADVVATNTPARRLFEKNGFSYAGDVDLELDIGDVPSFSLYELNF